MAISRGAQEVVEISIRHSVDFTIQFAATTGYLQGFGRAVHALGDPAGMTDIQEQAQHGDDHGKPFEGRSAEAGRQPPKEGSDHRKPFRRSS